MKRADYIFMRQWLRRDYENNLIALNTVWKMFNKKEIHMERNQHLAYQIHALMGVDGLNPEEMRDVLAKVEENIARCEKADFAKREWIESEVSSGQGSTSDRKS
jgi:hypothetical protein